MPRSWRLKSSTMHPRPLRKNKGVSGGICRIICRYAESSRVRIQRCGQRTRAPGGLRCPTGSSGNYGRNGGPTFNSACYSVRARSSGWRALRPCPLHAWMVEGVGGSRARTARVQLVDRAPEGAPHTVTVEAQGGSPACKRFNPLSFDVTDSSNQHLR